MNALANINGETMPLAEAKISALDRGFLFGDAVYEVLRIYRGKPWLEAEHFNRLEHSLKAIRIERIDVGRIRERMHATIAAGKFQEAICYIQITRGAAPRKHPFPAGVAPLEFLYVQEFADPYVEARKTGAAVVTQPDIRWERCDIKSTNLLANVMAMQAASEAGAVEALFYMPDGTLTEGTHTSFFGVMHGNILTRPMSHDILPGITRGLVLRLAQRANLVVHQQSLRLDNIADVSELFLTGTTSEVLPIVKVDHRAIGDGEPGPVTRRLQAAYAAEVEDFLRR